MPSLSLLGTIAGPGLVLSCWSATSGIPYERIFGPETPTGPYKHPACITELTGGDLYPVYCNCLPPAGPVKPKRPRLQRSMAAGPPGAVAAGHGRADRRTPACRLTRRPGDSGPSGPALAFGLAGSSWRPDSRSRRSAGRPPGSPVAGAGSHMAAADPGAVGGRSAPGSSSRVVSHAPRAESGTELLLTMSSRFRARCSAFQPIQRPRAAICQAALVHCKHANTRSPLPSARTRERNCAPTGTR